MKRTPIQKFSKLICHAMFYQGLDENAISWAIVEVVGTTILRGGGESTSWHPHTTIRLNGKQVWRAEMSYHHPDEKKKIIEDELAKLGSAVFVGREQQSDIYVLKP